MSNIIERLEDEVRPLFKTADEIYVAVALMSKEGMSLFKTAKEKCEIKVVVGIDLPTPPEVLEELMKYENGRVYRKPNITFHPKVYLIKEKNKYTAFIGSANCTNGGLCNNIELSYKITSKEDCLDIGCWFDDIYALSDNIDANFIYEYSKNYRKHRDTPQWNKDIEKFKKEEIIKADRKYIIQQLKAIKNGNNYYDDYVLPRVNALKKVKKYTDYKNSFTNFNINKYLSIKMFGNIRKTYIHDIERKKKELSDLLTLLCDDKDRSIADTYDLVFCEENKIKGCGENFITKILLAHNPNKYFLRNNRSKMALHRLGIQYKKGMSEGEKYEQECLFMKKIYIEAGIKDFAILDGCLEEIALRSITWKEIIDVYESELRIAAQKPSVRVNALKRLINELKENYPLIYSNPNELMNYDRKEFSDKTGFKKGANSSALIWVYEYIQRCQW